MTENPDFELNLAIESVCHAYCLLQKSDTEQDRALLGRTKSLILDMKGDHSRTDFLDFNFQAALVKTGDREICAGLPRGAKARPLLLPDTRQIEAITRHPERFMVMCDHGLMPPSSNLDLNAILDALRDAGALSEASPLAYSTHLWATRSKTFLSGIVGWIHTPNRIEDPDRAAFIASLVIESAQAYPGMASQYLSNAIRRFRRYPVIILHLAGLRPQPGETCSCKLTRKICDDFASQHGRLAMEKKFGSLAQFILDYDSADPRL